MDERKWLTATEPQSLLETAGGELSPRKLRLFAVACCRSMQDSLTSSQEHALRTAERHADGFATDEDLRAAVLQMFLGDRESRLAAEDPVHGHVARAVHAALYSESIRDLYVLTGKWDGPSSITPYGADAFRPVRNYALFTSINMAHAFAAFAGVDGSTSGQEELLGRVFEGHARLFREIVGSPYRGEAKGIGAAVQYKPAIRLFAAQIYLTSSFSDVPLLARMLIDSGLESLSILDHGAAAHHHVRGCWLVDLVLGLS